VTFEIVARRLAHTKSYDWAVNFGEGTDEVCFLDYQWQAFRSLLMPSTRADFTITEYNEKGEKL
jgi:hypothetical protein